MLVDDDPERARWVGEFLLKAGMQVSIAKAGRTLLKRISDVNPDIILIDIESPDRDMLESISVLSAHQPTPIVMFSEKRGSDFIGAAIAAGVTAYMIGEIEPTKVRPVIDAAMAQFQAFQEVRKALDQSQEELKERRGIEKAKFLLMQHHDMVEEDAFQFMRNQAMKLRLNLVEVAARITKNIEAEDRGGSSAK